MLYVFCWVDDVCVDVSPCEREREAHTKFCIVVVVVLSATKTHVNNRECTLDTRRLQRLTSNFHSLIEHGSSVNKETAARQLDEKYVSGFQLHYSSSSDVCSIKWVHTKVKTMPIPLPLETAREELSVLHLI